jgi:hypothetical protein
MMPPVSKLRPSEGIITPSITPVGHFAAPNTLGARVRSLFLKVLRKSLLGIDLQL